jgi:hypothetical protein
LASPLDLYSKSGPEISGEPLSHFVALTESLFSNFVEPLKCSVSAANQLCQGGLSFGDDSFQRLQLSFPLVQLLSLPSNRPRALLEAVNFRPKLT